MNPPEFLKITLPIKKNLFNELIKSVDFEKTGKGRIGNHLVDANENKIPIVRTTTNYSTAPNSFSPIHDELIELINVTVKNNALDILPTLNFNNALIEIYDSNYTKMKYHSDQSLDLDSDSYIAVFSCYEPDEIPEQNLRKLKRQDKITKEEFEISLSHNSVVLFSLSANKKFLHKIILESVPSRKELKSDNKWLGITFRKSKTFIRFKDNLPYLDNEELLTIANDNQKIEFYKLRSQENNLIDFEYPKLNYTVSIGDTLIPKNGINETI